MHVKANLLDSVGEVSTGERQVVEGLGEAPEVSSINNRRPGLDGDLVLHVHQCWNWLTVHHASSLKNIESKLALSEEESVRLILYGDSQKMMKGPEILHGEFPLEGKYGLLQKCCAGYDEDNVINIKQQVYRICDVPKDK
jgi:hypothetical protein